MPLTLVTGPANAAKARVALDAYEAWARAGREPLLVVPTSADVATYRHELAGRGLVLATTVVTPARLTGEVARRVGAHVRPVGPVARERVAARAARTAELRTLGPAAATAGFPRALLRLLDELAERRIGPARWWQAVRAWGAAEEARADYAEDLGALVAAYHRGLEALGRPDERGRDAAARDLLREDPSLWGATPVVLYGFDDLSPAQLDLVETLATRVGADVLVTLPYEAGRPAFAGRDHAYQELRALGPELVELAAPADVPAGTARALHALERGLFEEPDDVGGRPDPGPALLLLRGGGARAELELVAAHVKRLLRAGTPPAEVAIVLRRPSEHAALLARVLEASEVPYALERELPVGHTALGRGLLALGRCALDPEATADDLLAYLRTPGVLDVPALADGLEAAVRRGGLTSAAQARARWEAAHFRLGALDRLAAAAREGVEPLCAAFAAEARRLFVRPLRRRGEPLRPEEADDAVALRAVEGALEELGRLARADGFLAGPADVLAALADVTARLGRRGMAEGGAVWVGDPLGIRARRVRALFLCALEEGTFPAPARPEPLLGDAERRALNAAAGLRLDLHESAQGAERYLLYAATSRPTEVLGLSWHAADDAGRPRVRSPFVDDVLATVAPEVAERVEHREQGAAGWEDDLLAPSAHEAARSAAVRAESREDEPLGPLRDPLLLDELEATPAFSASALEAWHACPVRWFVERRLRPEELEPDPEPLVRGELAHAVLEDVLGARARSEGGGRALRPADVEALRAGARASLARLAETHPLSVNPERLRTALHRLEADLVGYLEQACEAGSRYVPARFEVAFGGGGAAADVEDGEEALPAVDVGGGLRLRGRIDRVDVASDGTALLHDYKGATAAPQARWLADGKLQLALYLRALPTLLGLDGVGGLYQPLAGGEDRRPRGAVLREADPDLDALRTDLVDPEELAELLDGALELALRAAAELRSGALEPRPRTCGFAGGGCAYPSICRMGGT